MSFYAPKPSGPREVSRPRTHCVVLATSQRSGGGFGKANKPIKNGSTASTSKLDHGVVDVVSIRDWGQDDGSCFDVGELKTQGPIRRILDGSNSVSFMRVVSNFLADAENSGTIQARVASDIEIEVPPFDRWAFREEHYEQYLMGY
jgi:hypothetical protein